MIRRIGIIPVVAVLVVTAATLYGSYQKMPEGWFDKVMAWGISPISAISGIICVVLVAKRDIRNYYWGLVNALTYGFIAYRSGYYGDSILNIGFYLPIQFIGYWQWRKNFLEDGDTSHRHVVSRKVSAKGLLALVLGVVAGTYWLGYLLDRYDRFIGFGESIYRHLDAYTGINGFGGMLDASTVVMSVMAQFLMVRAFREQWVLWILVNIVTIAMWAAMLLADPTSISWALPVLFMWISFLINSIYGAFSWFRHSNAIRESL